MCQLASDMWFGIKLKIYLSFLSGIIIFIAGPQPDISLKKILAFMPYQYTVILKVQDLYIIIY